MFCQWQRCCQWRLVLPSQMPAGEEKEYPEALFTFGELADVELEMPEETWQKIIKKASDKNYYECAVTINGEQFDDEDGLFKFEKRMT